MSYSGKAASVTAETAGLIACPCVEHSGLCPHVYTTGCSLSEWWIELCRMRFCIGNSAASLRHHDQVAIKSRES